MQLCGCCTGVTQTTPATIANRPGLPAIQYRAGTYSTFLETMLAALSSSSSPALAGLRTRSNADFSIALVDAWSEVLDILTFYTERLANEAYLGTAIEARSVFELARLVGYKPSPGVSASTVLAFTLATAPGSPAIVPIPAGTRVQSVPGPGQSPQVFESSANITATIASNAIPAVTSQPWQLFGGDTSTWIAGTANKINVGDALLFIGAPGGNPTVAQPAALVFVTAVTLDSVGGNTMIAWDQMLPSGLSGSQVGVYIFRTKAALFGANAPWPGMFPSATLQNIPGAPAPPSNGIISLAARTAEISINQIDRPVVLFTPAFPDWSWIYESNETIHLDNSYPGLNPVATSAPTASQLEWAALTGNGNTAIFLVQSASESNPAWYAVTAKTTQLTMSAAAPLAGFSASDVDTLLSDFVNQTRQTTAYVGSQLLTGANLPITAWPAGTTPYPLAPGMTPPVCGTTLAVQGLQPLAVGAPVAVSGYRVRIVATSAVASPGGGFTPAGATGLLPVSANQPFLVDAYPPPNDPNISGNHLWTVLTVTGQAGTLSLPDPLVQLQPAVTSQTQPAGAADPIAGEAAILSTVDVSGSTTALTFAAAIARAYDASTVKVNANAVEATHGETMQEILGSGDATNSDLEFQLKQSPLTYVSAQTATGIQSTLQVRVNNLLWTEVGNFLNSAPADRVYVTRPNSGAGPTVQFGDGSHGSRTPTGTSNIQAQYRKGIGLAGMVAPGQLTQPLDRPQGLQSVTNPSAATGGADPATPADAQISAPLPTLTLGRVVSLEDYQNFALNFGGIALALATWTWFGATRGVFLTVAGEGGTILSANDTVVQNLQLALKNFGMPYVPVQVVSYDPVLFEIGMQVLVNTPTYDPGQVVAQVWQSLTTAFAFGQMQPGQSVAASYAIQLAQQVPGVIAVNLTALNQSGDATAVQNILCASGPQPTKTPPLGAQVLLLDPASQGNVGVWA